MMRYARLGKWFPLLLLLPLVLAIAPHQARALAVDIELMLLIDVSASIDDETEYPLQMQGYRDAFNDPRVLSAIQGGELGRIAVRADFWSSANQYETAVDWTMISDASSASAFATEIGEARRPFRGITAPGNAIVKSLFAFMNEFTSDRQVIDISGDGTQNDGFGSDAAVRYALLFGIDTINALAIEGDRLARSDGAADSPTQTIGEWYDSHLKAGDDAFVMQVSSFEDFGDAVVDKIILEVAGPTVVPLPGAIWLFGCGLIALMGLTRRPRNQIPRSPP